MTKPDYSLSESFLSQYPLLRIKKGNVLIRHGEKIYYLYYIKSGICACSIIHLSGNQIVPLFLREHELVGVRQELLGEKENRSLSEISAHTDIEVYKIPVEDIRNLLQNDFDAYRRIAGSVIRSLDRVIETAMMREKGNSVMLVCHMLQHEMSPCTRSNGIYRLSDYFNITVLSRMLHLHRVTVSKIMHRLILEGVLKKEDDIWYIINPDKLNKYRQGILTLNLKPKQ